MSNASETTYSEDGRVVGHLRRLVLLGGGSFLDPQVLDIAASEDDVLVDLLRGLDLVYTILATLSAEGRDILQGDGGGLGVDLVERTDVSAAISSGTKAGGGDQVATGCRCARPARCAIYQLGVSSEAQHPSWTRRTNPRNSAMLTVGGSRIAT